MSANDTTSGALSPDALEDLLNGSPGQHDTMLSIPANAESVHARKPTASVLACSIEAEVTLGDNETLPVGSEFVFMLEAKNGNGDPATGEPVEFLPTFGNGEFIHADKSVDGSGSITAIFVPSGTGPFAIECRIGRGGLVRLPMVGNAIAVEQEEEEAVAPVTAQSASESPSAIATDDEYGSDQDYEVLDESDEESEESSPEVAIVPQGTDAAVAAVDTVVAATAPADEVDSTSALERAEAEARETLKRVSEPTAAQQEAVLPEPVSVKPAVTPVDTRKGPTVSDSQIDAFISASDPDAVDDRKVSAPPATRLPKEARHRFTTRRVGNALASLSGRAIMVIGAMVLMLIVITLSVRREPVPAVPAAQAQTAQGTGTSVQASGAAKTGKLVYRCSEATRATDPSDSRYDTLRCTPIGQ